MRVAVPGGGNGAHAAIVERWMAEGQRGAREGVGLADRRGRDMAAYQKALIGRFVALFARLKLLPAPGAADRLDRPEP